MADVIYSAILTALAAGEVDLADDTLRLMLVTDGYTPSAAHVYRSSVTNETSGPGYTAGGQALANKTLGLSSDVAVFDADDVVWTSSTITARGAVLYQDTGSAATDRLIKYFDFTTNLASTLGDFRVQFDASGILRIGVAA